MRKFLLVGLVLALSFSVLLLACSKKVSLGNGIFLYIGSDVDGNELRNYKKYDPITKKYYELIKVKEDVYEYTPQAKIERERDLKSIENNPQEKDRDGDGGH